MSNVLLSAFGRSDNGDDRAVELGEESRAVVGQVCKTWRGFVVQIKKSLVLEHA